MCIRRYLPPKPSIQTVSQPGLPHSCEFPLLNLHLTSFIPKTSQMTLLGLAPDDEFWELASASFYERTINESFVPQTDSLAAFRSFYGLNRDAKALKSTDESDSIVANIENFQREVDQTAAYISQMILKEEKELSNCVDSFIAEETRKIKEREAREKAEAEAIVKAKIEALKKQKEKEEKLKLEEKAKEEDRKKKEALAKAKLEQQEREELEAENKKKEEKARLDLEQKQLADRRSKGITNFEEIDRTFRQYKQAIQDIKNDTVEPYKTLSVQVRKDVNMVKRKINAKFGQLSNSLQHLNTLAQDMIQQVSAVRGSGNTIAYKWLLNFMAKAIVDQAEQEVAIKPTAAVPLARLSLVLLNEFSEFNYYLEARLVKKCPYIIGYTCDIDTEEGRERMGWRRRDGKWEDLVKHEERVSGICTFWGVMAGYSGVLGESLNGLISMKAMWMFAARMCNLPFSKLTGTHFECVANWFDACSRFCVDFYGPQGLKLLVAVLQLPLTVSEKKFPGAARLLLLVEKTENYQVLPGIKEMER